MQTDVTNRAADNIRILSAAMVEKAKSGHPGGAMGGADFVNVLYTEFLRFDPTDPNWHMRDRFFLDPGHMSPMLYSVLALCGYYTLDELTVILHWLQSKWVMAREPLLRRVRLVISTLPRQITTCRNAQPWERK